DAVLSCYGTGEFRSATVTDTYRRTCRRDLVEIELVSGRKLISTPEHAHFAQAALLDDPQPSSEEGVMTLVGSFSQVQAGSVQPGMVMLRGNCAPDVVMAVRRIPGK